MCQFVLAIFTLTIGWAPFRPCLHGQPLTLPTGGGFTPSQGRGLPCNACCHLEVHEEATWIFKRFLDPHEERHRTFAVDDAVVVG